MIFKPFMAFMCFFWVPPTKARSYIDRMRVRTILFFVTLTGAAGCAVRLAHFLRRHPTDPCAWAHPDRQHLVEDGLQQLLRGRLITLLGCSDQRAE